MFNISYLAGEHFGQMLADLNTPSRFVIRVHFKNSELNFKLDTIRTGDTTFMHCGKTVLVMDEETSEIITGMQLVVQGTGEESRLTLIEQIDEFEESTV